MPEPIDFDQLAVRHAIERLVDDDAAAVELAQAFRDVWNARGAADIAIATVNAGYLDDVINAIKTLDR